MTTRPVETNLAALMVEHLRTEGFEVYQEVRHSSGRIADIVAVRGDETRVVEVKVNLSFALMEQAEFWLEFATSSCLAAPLPQDARARRFACQVCIDRGIGVYDLSNLPRLVERPKLDWRIGKSFNLTEAHKEGKAPAGTQTGERVSKAQEVRDDVLAFVTENPGCSVATIVSNVSLPLGRTTRAHDELVKQLRAGDVPGVWVTKGNGVWWAHLTSAPIAGVVK